MLSNGKGPYRRPLVITFVYRLSRPQKHRSCKQCYVAMNAFGGMFAAAAAAGYQADPYHRMAATLTADQTTAMAAHHHHAAAAAAAAHHHAAATAHAAHQGSHTNTHKFSLNCPKPILQLDMS